MFCSRNWTKMGIFSFVLLVSCIAASLAEVPPHTTTLRPPSYPLAVRGPYSSVWLHANELAGHWPAFWQGTPKGWEGMIRIDGETWEWMGATSVQAGSPVHNVATQMGSHITPTKTIFYMTAGPVNLNVTFMSPVEYEDVERQSIPLSYMFVTVEPITGRSHDVQVYVDITGEWASSEHEAVVTWDITQSAALKTWSTQRQNQLRFSEWADYAQWGSAVFTTSSDASHASGSDRDMRGRFVASGLLNNTNDENFRCVSCDWPTFAFVHDLGSISSLSRTLQYTMGHVREENINLMTVPQKALWTHYFSDVHEMIQFFYDDVETAMTRSNALDVKVINDAFDSYGQDHVDIVSLSLRQAYGGTEFSGTPDAPILYLKEISSNGNMQTVDVIYPTTPVFYYLNVKYTEYILEPLWYQMENGFWPKPYSMHDIGFNFPNATGHLDGVQEDMPVEESANMIMMVGNYIFNPNTPNADAVAYAQKHYQLLSSWADYLYFNCLYPVDQLTTDDFIGPTELNSGLALKGILGLKTFAKISELVGNENATSFYNTAVSEFVPIWIMESMHNDQDHLKMEYNVTNGYQFKYNAFQDKLLRLNTVPEEIYTMEAAYYLTKEEEFGIPFVSTHDYTKSDWEMWTAAAYGDANPTLRTNILRQLSHYLQMTRSRVPFSDWYVTANANHNGFRSRPVVGGHFSILALLANSK